MELESKTLQNNKISQFILRIDLAPGTTVSFKELAESLSSDYGSVRTELHINYNVNMETVNVKREEFLTFILGKAPQVTLTLNGFERCIVLNSSHYLNNSVYRERLARIVDLLKEVSPEVAASRIGMRYINVFPTNNPAEIGKYLNPVEANCIKETLKRDSISRAVLVHEYQLGDYQARIQCGVPNKFYPSVITNYELVLDIDVYGLGVQPLTSWQDSVRDYNHGAYDMFTRYVKQSFIDAIR